MFSFDVTIGDEGTSTVEIDIGSSPVDRVVVLGKEPPGVIDLIEVISSKVNDTAGMKGGVQPGESFVSAYSVLHQTARLALDFGQGNSVCAKHGGIPGSVLRVRVHADPGQQVAIQVE